MKFSKDEKWAVNRALKEMYADGVPQSTYSEAYNSIHVDGQDLIVDEDTEGGWTLVYIACEILYSGK